MSAFRSLLAFLLLAVLILTACTPETVIPPNPPAPTVQSVVPTQPAVESPDPVAVIQTFHSEFNAGNADGALEVLADEAVIKIVYGKSDDPVLGKDAFREVIVSSSQDHFMIEASDYQVSDEKVTFRYSGIGDGLKELGVGPEVGSAEAVIQNGEIQSLTYTVDPEWVAKADAAEAALANTGQAEASPTLQPTLPALVEGETVVTSSEELVGIWRGRGGSPGDPPQAFWEFTGEGAYRVAFNLQDLIDGFSIEAGQYSFEGNVLVLQASRGGCAADDEKNQYSTGRYEARITRSDSGRVTLRMISIEEACISRRTSLGGVLPIVEP
jgi:hypothetical protein